MTSPQLKELDLCLEYAPLWNIMLAVKSRQLATSLCMIGCSIYRKHGAEEFVSLQRIIRLLHAWSEASGIRLESFCVSACVTEALRDEACALVTETITPVPCEICRVNTHSLRLLSTD